MSVKQFLLLVFLISNSMSTSWTVELLLEYYKSCSNCQQIINPDGFLSKEEVLQIESKMSEIKEYRSRLIVLESLDPIYFKYFSGKDIDSFVEFFLQGIEPIEAMRHKTLTVLYSIKDRKYKWRTGSEARKVLPDSKCNKIADYIKSDLKSKHYGVAFYRLFKMVNEPLPFDWGFWAFWSFIGFFIGVICLTSCIQSYHERKLSKKIRTIKNINESKEQFNLFTETNCVICLEELNNKDLKPHTHRVPPVFDHNSNNAIKEFIPFDKQPNVIDKDRLLESPPEQIDASKLNQLPSNESVFLECGHNFHAGCLLDWSLKSKICPICRVRFDAEVKASKGTPVDNNILLDILIYNHRGRYRENEILYYYNNGRFQGSTGSSSGYSGGGFDFGSGGTSGGW